MSQAERRLRMVFYAVLKLAVTLLQMLIPPHARRVAYMSQPDFSDNPYFMFRFLLQTRDSLEHVWVVRDMTIASRIREEFDACCEASFGHQKNSLVIVRRASLEGIWTVLMSRVCFHTHGTLGFQKAAPHRVVMCLWHGMPIKCIGRLNTVTPNPFPTFGTHHQASSHFFKYIIAQAFGAPAERVIVSGAPRCDVLKGHMTPRFDRQDICQKLGLNAEKRIILWMPTYRTERLVEGQAFRSFLDDMPERSGTNFAQKCVHQGCELLVKLHPYDGLNQMNLADEFAPGHLLTAADFERSGIPLYELVAISDALITDVSSILIDYLLTGRPIGVLGFDERTYTRDTVFPPDQLLSCDAVTRLNSTQAIDAFLERVVSASPSSECRPGDCAGIFNEDHDIYSCAQIAQICGV